MATNIYKRCKENGLPIQYVFKDSLVFVGLDLLARNACCKVGSIFCGVLDDDEKIRILVIWISFS